MTDRFLSEPVKLRTPIARGDKQTITEIRLREPCAGDLRGIKLFDVLQLDVATLHDLLPRITQPLLTKEEVKALHPADLLKAGSSLLTFFTDEAPGVSPDA